MKAFIQVLLLYGSRIYQREKNDFNIADSQKVEVKYSSTSSFKHLKRQSSELTGRHSFYISDKLA